MKNKKVTSAKKEKEKKVDFDVVFTTDCRTVRELAMFTVGFIFASEFGALPKVAIILLVDKLADMQIMEFTRDERELAVVEVVNQYARNTKKILGVSDKVDKATVTSEKPVEAEVTVNGKPIAVIESVTPITDDASRLKAIQENPRTILLMDDPTKEMVLLACKSSAGAEIVQFAFARGYYYGQGAGGGKDSEFERMQKLLKLIISLDDKIIQEIILKIQKQKDGTVVEPRERDWGLITKNPMMLLTIPDPTDKMVEVACLADVNVATIALNNPTSFENIVMKIMDSEIIINFLEANEKLALLNKSKLNSKQDNKQEQHKTKQEEKTEPVAKLREEPKPIHHQKLIELLENMADKKEEDLTDEDLSGLQQFMGNINVYINIEAYKNACKIFGKLVKYSKVRLRLESIADQRLKNPTSIKAKANPKKSPIPKKVNDAISSVKNCGASCRVCSRVRDLSKTSKPVSADLVLVRYFMRDSVSFALMHGQETAEIFHTLLDDGKFNLEVSHLITKESKNDFRQELLNV